ncbi:MAG: YhhA family cyclophane-containing RiPP [Methylococcaceae bacterium]
MQNINQPLQENMINKSFLADLFMTDVASPTLARLIEEVKNDSKTLHVYDRAHNRHNR